MDYSSLFINKIVSLYKKLIILKDLELLFYFIIIILSRNVITVFFMCFKLKSDGAMVQLNLKKKLYYGTFSSFTPSQFLVQVFIAKMWVDIDMI